MWLSLRTVENYSPQNINFVSLHLEKCIFPLCTCWVNYVCSASVWKSLLHRKLCYCCDDWFSQPCFSSLQRSLLLSIGFHREWFTLYWLMLLTQQSKNNIFSRGSMLLFKDSIATAQWAKCIHHDPRGKMGNCFLLRRVLLVFVAWITLLRTFGWRGVKGRKRVRKELLWVTLLWRPFACDDDPADKSRPR